MHCCDMNTQKNVVQPTQNQSNSSLHIMIFSASILEYEQGFSQKGGDMTTFGIWLWYIIPCIEFCSTSRHHGHILDPCFPPKLKQCTRGWAKLAAKSIS